MKVKTKQANVLTYGEKKGAVLEVDEKTGEHLLKLGVVEKVKQAPTKTTKKPAPKKKDGDK